MHPAPQLVGVCDEQADARSTHQSENQRQPRAVVHLAWEYISRDRGRRRTPANRRIQSPVEALRHGHARGCATARPADAAAKRFLEPLLLHVVCSGRAPANTEGLWSNQHLAMSLARSVLRENVAGDRSSRQHDGDSLSDHVHEPAIRCDETFIHGILDHFAADRPNKPVRDQVIQAAHRLGREQPHRLMRPWTRKQFE